MTVERPKCTNFMWKVRRELLGETNPLDEGGCVTMLQGTEIHKSLQYEVYLEG